MDIKVLGPGCSRCEQTEKIVELELVKICDRLAEQDLSLEAAPEAISFLAQEGYSEEFGARNLRRTVRRSIEDVLSESILAGEYSKGDQVFVDVQDGEIVLSASRGEAEPPLLEAVMNV